MNQNLFRYHFLLLILCVLVGLNHSLANETNVDSLMQVAGNTAASNASRIEAYGELVLHYETVDPDLALQLGKKGLTIPVDTAFDLLGVLQANIGFVYYAKQELENGLPHFKEAAIAFEKADKKRKAGVQYKNIGIFYRKLGDAKNAAENQLKALKLFEEIDDIPGQVTAKMNIGNVYIYQNQAELAVPYFRDALRLARLQTDSTVIVEALNSYALGFDNLSQNDSAIYYYLQAIDLYRIQGKALAKAKAEHNLAMIYFEEESFAEAEKMLLASQAVFAQIPNRFAIEKAKISVSLGRIYYNSNRPSEAIPLIEAGIETFREKKTLSALKTSLLYLAQAYDELGDYEKAYQAQLDFMVMKDSIQNAEIMESVAEMTEKYESEKKENEILTLKNENIAKEKQTLFTLVVSGGILAILIILFLIYRQVKIRQLTEMRIKLKQNVRELDLMREKIEQGTTQYLTPSQFTIDRSEVNSMLKEDLSERELDVFMLLIEGLTNKEIGEKLFISVSTIKYHLQNIYLKLDVNNRKDAVQALTTRTGTAA